MSALNSGNESEDEQQSSNCSTDFMCLTELVRQRYVNYLERQLQENVNAWLQQQNGKGYDPPTSTIKQCVRVLEERAVNTCIMAHLYQRNMVKIIATVRRDTQECLLEHTLKEHLNLTPKIEADKMQETSYAEKATQTDDYIDCHQKNNLENRTSLGVQQKIDLFQLKLETALSTPHRTTGKSNSNDNILSSSKRVRKKSSCVIGATVDNLPLATNQPITQLHVSEEDDDVVSRELAQLFGEEKSELDDIFGINPQASPDDPQLTRILQEIQHAKAQALNSTKPHQVKTVAVDDEPDTHVLSDLRRSLWPCELYMRRSQLSIIISRLIENDLRWHELIKWRFNLLFGEDSDDECGTVSPTIDLNEVLISSCIRRISPWVVKELMKPLNEGVIGNRFLFKKLAKKLAYWIIMENQYPDEKFVKHAVENFFCWKHAVYTVDDLKDISCISFKNLE